MLAPSQSHNSVINYSVFKFNHIFKNQDKDSVLQIVVVDPLTSGNTY